MELDELKQGLQDIQRTEPPSNGAESPSNPWLGMDNLMGSYGGWFGNDKGLGELLLGQLRARGVDTQAATEAMLREILTGLVDDLNLLQQKLTGFTQAVSQQMQEISDVKDSVDTALAQAGSKPAAQDVGGPVGSDIPPAGGEIEPPADVGAAPAVEGEVPPEGGVEETPPAPDGEAAPVAEEPSAEEKPPAEEEAPPDETLSDKRMKKVKGCVLSDKGMKKIIASVAKPKGMRFSMDAIRAARRFDND